MTAKPKQLPQNAWADDFYENLRTTVNRRHWAVTEKMIEVLKSSKQGWSFCKYASTWAATGRFADVKWLTEEQHAVPNDNSLQELRPQGLWRLQRRQDHCLQTGGVLISVHSVWLQWLFSWCSDAGDGIVNDTVHRPGLS